MRVRWTIGTKIALAVFATVLTFALLAEFGPRDEYIESDDCPDRGQPVEIKLMGLREAVLCHYADGVTLIT